MSRSIRFVPEVEDDLINAYDWYESRSTGLGEDYLRMFNAAVHHIQKRPSLYRKVHGEVRRVLLRRFPCALYYRVDEEHVVVYGVFHCARNP